MPSLNFHVALLLPLVGPAATARLEHDILRMAASNVANLSEELLRVAADDAGNLSKFEMPKPGDLAKIGTYLKQSDIAATLSRRKIKCCCDKWGTSLGHKMKASWHYDIKERSERCLLLHNHGNDFGCGSYPKPGWAALSLHSDAHAEQECTVHKSIVKRYYEVLGSPTKYCTAADLPVEKGRLEPAAVKLGEKFKLQCDPSYEAETKMDVECVYNTPEAGKLKEKLKCKMVVHCAETGPTGLMGDPRVAATGLGLPGKPFCGQRGYQPIEGVSPTCQENGKFSVMPMCEKQPEYCKGGLYSAPGLPTVQSTSIYDTVKVDCDEDGWESRERVECNEEGEFQPPPECSKINAYCKGAAQEDVEGKPEFSAATVDEPMKLVWCSQNGYVMIEDAEAATCGKDGNPVFNREQPLCKKVPNFCMFFDMAAEGGLTLSSKEAALGQTVQVICDAAGYEPAVKESTCGEWSEFQPAPACKKIEGPVSKNPLCPSSIWSFCSEADLKDGGVACVFSADAEVKDASEVQCVPKENNLDGDYVCPAQLPVKCEPFE